jgi:hypothetical protein
MADRPVLKRPTALSMNENVTITLSHDEALVLFEFFSRFCDDGDGFIMRHTAEYVAFMGVSAQLDKAMVEPFEPRYAELLSAARDRIGAGFDGPAPGVRYACDAIAARRKFFAGCQCCLCGESIGKAVGLELILAYEDESEQQFWAHAACFKSRSHASAAQYVDDQPRISSTEQVGDQG